MVTRVPCQCCGYLTLPARGDFDICPVCFWEDDYMDGTQIGPIKFPSGPNEVSPGNEMTLNQAKKNYQAYGAIKMKFLHYVRAPMDEERP